MVSKRKKDYRRAFALGAVIALGAPLLAGCGETSAKENVHFTFSKREAIGFMSEVVADFNASQDKYEVEMDTSGVDVISASFVRGNPPDLMLANYNFEVARFVQRCAVSDLSDTVAASKMNKDLQPLMDQYGVCEGTIPAIPYSVMGAAVIYNKDIFDQHNVDVPQTWSELIEVSDTLKAAGVDPFYGTFADAWTVNQGWSDYSIGGSLDVLDFFNKIAAEGDQVGPNSEYSFSKDFQEPYEKMVQLAQNYTNADAASRTYDRGNVEFANGAAAMYLQGPWAFSEIAKTNPDANLGTFPLPMTEDPNDLKIRVNMDLAAMIPVEAKNPEGARAFLEYLFQEDVITAYNQSQLGFVPQEGGAVTEDPRVEGTNEYYQKGAFYQGAGVLMPKAIPIENYTQAIILGENIPNQLRILDADWSRVAYRQPAPTVEEGGDQ